MNTDDREDLAAAYALGPLDWDERGRTAFAQLEDKALRDAVLAWEQRLAPLAFGTPSVEPPLEIWASIEARLDEKLREPGATTLLEADGDWLQVAEGVEKKRLFVDREQGIESYLLRMAPGSELTEHDHDKDEECLMLEGEISIGDLVLRKGDFHVVRAGTPHPRVTTRTGGMFYVRGEIRAAA